MICASLSPSGELAIQSSCPVEFCDSASGISASPQSATTPTAIWTGAPAPVLVQQPGRLRRDGDDRVVMGGERERRDERPQRDHQRSGVSRAYANASSVSAHSSTSSS